VAITPDGTHAFVTNQFDNTVSVIDTANNKVVATIPVGSFATGVAITPAGTHPTEPVDRRHPTSAYVTNQLDGTVSVIDTANNTVVATIPVQVDPSGVAITPDGTRAYVANTAGNDQANQFDRTVSMINTARNTVVATILVGFGPNGVTVTPNGTGAYVTNSIDGTVSVIDIASNKVVATIPVGNFPLAVAFATVTPAAPDCCEQ
jgi:YVTN family beta-propeller protein